MTCFNTIFKDIHICMLNSYQLPIINKWSYHLLSQSPRYEIWCDSNTYTLPQVRGEIFLFINVFMEICGF